MPNPPNGSNNPNGPNFPTKVIGKCVQCQTPISTPFPPLVTFNSPTVSSILVPHPKGATCPKCNLWHMIIINAPACSIALALLPAEKPTLNDDNLIEEVKSLPSIIQ